MNWPLFHPARENTGWTYREDVFTDAEINRIIKLCNPVATPAVIGDGVINEYRRSDIAWLDTEDPDFDWIYATLAPVVTEINNSYYKFDLTKIQTLQFTKYSDKNNGAYLPHLDIGRLKPTRKLSFSVQLSDTNEYAGGDLQFLHLKSTPDMAPRMRGNIIFFPSWLAHEVTPVTKGVRYSLVGWVEGPLFK